MGLSLQIRSDVGVFHAALSWIDHDLLMLRDARTGPWLATLMVTPDGLRLTSDRTKGLRLSRA